MPETTSALTTSNSPSEPLDRDSLLSIVEAILEPGVLAISLWIVSICVEGGLLPAYLLLSIIVFAVSFPGTPRLHTSVWRLVTDVIFNWLWIAALLALLAFATHYDEEFSLRALTIWLVAAPLSQIAAHLMLRRFARHLVILQGPAQRAVIVGMNDQGVALATRINETPYARISFSGFFDDRDRERLTKPDEFPVLGALSGLSNYVKEHGIQLIYLSMPMASQPRILQILDELKDTTASIYFVPDMFITDLIQGRTGTVCGMPVISVCETPFTGTRGAIKRISDVLLSLIILAVISPILLIIAIGVKMSSSGPVIFKQRRYGLDGKEIYVYKFRSMTVCEDGGVIRQAQRGDNRITPLGAILRKTSLDELPQFVNVLQGRMSIVGPRPHAVAHNELYRTLIKGYMIRHKVKPGITGWAQVNGYRGETDTLDKMQARIDYDLDYLRNWTLKLDLHIILKTVLVVFKDQTAY